MANFATILRTLGPGRTLSLLLAGIGLVVFFAYLMIRASSPEMGLLFSQLDPADGGRIIEKLKTMQVPFEIKGDGNQIFVPIAEVARIRMELAQDGMPSGGIVGYELFDRNDVLGTTTLLTDINNLRALEGELAKSIKTIQGVQSARVHLVMPKKELFSKDTQKPSASIMIRMNGASILSANQVQAIQYLVSSAIANLTLDRVSVVDDKGNLLARGNDNAAKVDSVTIQNTTKLELENKLSRTIESLLDRTLGLGKSRAEVSVELDFDQETSTSVIYDPDGQVARSTTSNEEGVDANENQSADVVSIQSALPNQTNQPSQSLSKNQSSNNQETVNFEISNTTKTLVKEVGKVKRLSIAVMVDGIYNQGQDGKKSYQKRNDDELEKLKTLVKTAVGFKDDRGDAISLVNLQFSEADPELFKDKDEEKSFFKSFLKSLNPNKIIELALSTLVLLIGLLAVIKPVLKALYTPAYNTALATAGGGNIMYQKNPSNNKTPDNFGQNNNSDNETTDNNTSGTGKEGSNESSKLNMPAHRSSGINMDEIEESVGDSVVKKVSELVERHPDEAIAIIRSWLYAK